jgi:hypothetical protein
MTTRRSFLRASALLPVSAWALPGLARAWADDDPDARAKSTNNLKQIGLAFHNYHSTKNFFPPAAVLGGDSTPLLSWRVLILPYVEQQDLYERFHMDEAWDSPHNKELLAKMPSVYAPVVVKEGMPENSTYYQGFKGTGCTFDGESGQPIASFTDGTSNTLMVVEAEKLVPWTKPVDLILDDDKEKPLPKLGGQFEGGTTALFCDGAVRFLKKDIAPETLRALITRNQGEVIAGDDF